MAFRVHGGSADPESQRLKFVLDRPIADQPTSFFNAGAAKDHPLARRLFAIPGVSSLLLLGDFVTVNKIPTPAGPISRAGPEGLAEA